jgi:hypothetical protein
MEELRQDGNVRSGKEEFGMSGDAIRPGRLAGSPAATALLYEIVVLERCQLSLDRGSSEFKRSGKLIHCHWPTPQKF